MPRLPSILPRKSVSARGLWQSRPLCEQGVSWPSRGNPCLDTLVRENLGLRACTAKGCLQRCGQRIAFSQRSDSSLQSFDLQTCLGGGCFWGRLVLRCRRALSRSHCLVGCGCPLETADWLRFGGTFCWPAFGHFSDFGRGPRMICTHPSTTGAFDHPLGITNNKKGRKPDPRASV